MNNNTNNINSILEAVGELDNDILENAFKPRKKKPVTLIMIAAAAAALSILVGFTIAQKNNVVLDGKVLFEYNIRLHNEVVLPSVEELTESGAHDFNFVLNGYNCSVKGDPREVIEKFGLTPLTNDNFSMFTSDDPDDPLSQMRLAVSDNLELRGERESSISFLYCLFDDKRGIPVEFIVDCFFGDFNTQHTMDINGDVKGNGDKQELIDLNNGEKALIFTDNMRADGNVILKDGEELINRTLATFTYDGMIYKIIAETDIDGMKQVLSDLGITKPNFDYHKQSGARILTADELIALGAEGDSRGYTLTAVPSELFAEYNITTVINTGFFAEEQSEIRVIPSPGMAIIDYTLTDKETGKPLSVEAQFFVSGESTFEINYSTIDGKPSDAFNHCETIYLADGSQVFVADRYSQLVSGYNAQAVFCSNGVGYRLSSKNTDINEMKLILKKLGAAAE